MTDVGPQPSLGALATALKGVRQTAYVASNGELAAEKLQEGLGVGPFLVLDETEAVFDVIDSATETKTDEVQLRLWFAMDRTVEIIEPFRAPSDVFDVSGLAEGELRFHHVAGFAPDLGPCLDDARAKSLPVFRIRNAVVDAAFVDLRSVGGHWFEIVQPLE
jgi:hypothetical protein